MNKKEFVFLLLFTTFVISIFFAKVIFFHQIPFPGDFLVASSPFKTESYLGYPPGAYPSKAQGRDVIAQLFPWKSFSITQIKNGSLPLWNPYNFSGNPHIANYQTGVFYPLNVVFLLFSFPISWSLFIILQPILALLFMYIFLRNLKISLITSLVGGIAFAFSSYMTVWLEWGNIGHTLLWLPLMFFSIRQTIIKKNISSSILFVVAATCCVLAGYIQGAFYVFCVSALYGVCLLIQQKQKKLWWYIVLLFIIPVGLCALQILPTITIFLSSTRGAYSSSQIHNLLNPWYYLVTLFASEFFGNPATKNFSLPITYYERVMYPGIPILFFALYGLQKIKNLETKFFGILAAITLLFTTALPGVSIIYTLPIPVLSTTVPTRLLSIFIFCVIVLGAFGIDTWIKKTDLKSFVPYIFGGIYILLWLIVLVGTRIHPEWTGAIAVAKHNLILSTAIAFATIFIFYIRRKLHILSTVLLVLLVIADQHYIFTKFTPFAPVNLIYPSTPVISYLKTHAGINRSWGYGRAYIDANYATEFGVYGADGYDSLFSGDYGRLLNSSVIGKVTHPLSRTDANIAPVFGSGSLRDNIYREKILNLLGVKYILYLTDGNSEKPDEIVFPSEKYTLLWHTGPWQIYQNLNVLPRFFLANQYKIVTPKNDIQQIYATDLLNTVLLYEKPRTPLEVFDRGLVTLKNYQPNIITFVTNTKANELLFLSDTYDSGWQATVDGKTAKVYKADVAFRAVEIPKGQHAVVFLYHPQSFQLGIIITLVTAVIGGCFLLIIRKPSL